MYRDLRFRVAGPLGAALLVWMATPAAPAQQNRPTSRLDVEQYSIEAEVTPSSSTLAAKTSVRFLPVGDGITSATFELNNALNVSRVVDEGGKQIPVSRNQQDSTLRLSFEQPLAAGKDRKSTRLNSSHLGISYAV